MPARTRKTHAQPDLFAERGGGGNVAAAWKSLKEEASHCTRCDLYKCATQTVFGEGRLDAPIVFVGEQPGDQEDLAGRPFVGPAGQLFDAALQKAGIDRSDTYVTNAVKHFKFVLRGKRRIHQSPDAGEIQACRWWIDHERELLHPVLTVALGGTAARSLFGKVMAIGRNIAAWRTSCPTAVSVGSRSTRASCCESPRRIAATTSASASSRTSGESATAPRRSPPRSRS